MPPKAVSGLDTKRSIIPSSRRPDGSLRKQIQVKPGFIPVEDQIAFVSSRIKQIDVVVGGGERKAKIEETGLSAAALKNLRRKERKQAAASQSSTTGDADIKAKDAVSVDKAEQNVESEQSKPATTIVEPAKVPVEKQIRNLQKKLRKIDELVAKQNDGGILDSDQIEKISKRSEIEQKILKLEKSLS